MINLLISLLLIGLFIKLNWINNNTKSFIYLFKYSNYNVVIISLISSLIYFIDWNYNIFLKFYLAYSFLRLFIYFVYCNIQQECRL